jgi:hypothetical protein
MLRRSSAPTECGLDRRRRLISSRAMAVGTRFAVDKSASPET